MRLSHNPLTINSQDKSDYDYISGEDPDFNVGSEEEEEYGTSCEEEEQGEGLCGDLERQGHPQSGQGTKW